MNSNSGTDTGNARVAGIAFDLEGTLIDLEWAHWQGHLDAAAQVGLTLTTEQGLLRVPHWVGGPDEKIAEDIAALLGAPDLADEILRATKAAFLRHVKYAAEIVPRPGVLEFLEHLSRRNLPYAIGSLTDRAFGRHLLRVSGLDKWFAAERVVFKEDVTRLKPAPDVYLETARRLGIAAAGQLVFEDSANGVRAATAAGSAAVAVPVVKTELFAQQLREAGATMVLEGWHLWQGVLPLIECPSGGASKQLKQTNSTQNPSHASYEEMS